MNKKKANITFLGFLIFFITIALICTIVIISFCFIYTKTNNLLITALIVAGLVVMLAFFCTLIDMMRRQYEYDTMLNEILDATERITKGDFDVTLSTKNIYEKYSEFDHIKININKMAQALRNNEALNNDFVANFSHEIKTPLAIIQNYASALLDKKLDNATREEYSQTLYNASNRLSNLVSNILKLNKLENQQLFVSLKQIDLGEFLRNAIINFEDLIQKKDITLNIDIQDVVVQNDEFLLEIIVNNLLSNAIKFTPYNGTISISLSEQQDNIILKISDTGCGMDSETGKHIFDKFYQGDTSHSKEGNGLGLPLVKRAITTLGGQIKVSSEVGIGSTFTVILNKNNKE